MKTKTILVDLDHTMSHAAPRDHLLGDWELYHNELINDKPCVDIIRLVHSLYKMEHPIVGITGRPEKWRSLSTQWLLRHGVTLHDLLMRPDDDYRPNAEVKILLAKDAFGPNLKDEILFIIDDNLEVIEAFHAEGITCLHVYGRNYE